MLNLRVRLISAGVQLRQPTRPNGPAQSFVRGLTGYAITLKAPAEAGRDDDRQDQPMPHGTTARLADPRRRLSSAVSPKASWAAAALSSPPGPARFGLELDDRSFLIARGRGLIGREPVAPNGEQPTHLVTLTDPARSVSRTHLEFGIGNAGLWVRDCHSTNGSDIEFDGQVTPLEPGLAVPVRPASTIHLGARRVRVCTVECRAVIDVVTVEWGAASRVGCRRERNQDTFGAHPPVFVVADGIGSHGAGDLASHQAVPALLGAGRSPTGDRRDVHPCVSRRAGPHRSDPGP